VKTFLVPNCIIVLDSMNVLTIFRYIIIVRVDSIVVLILTFTQQCLNYILTFRYHACDMRKKRHAAKSLESCSRTGSCDVFCRKDTMIYTYVSDFACTCPVTILNATVRMVRRCTVSCVWSQFSFSHIAMLGKLSCVHSVLTHLLQCMIAVKMHVTLI